MRPRAKPGTADPAAAAVAAAESGRPAVRLVGLVGLTKTYGHGPGTVPWPAKDITRSWS